MKHTALILMSLGAITLAGCAHNYGPYAGPQSSSRSQAPQAYTGYQNGHVHPGRGSNWEGSLPRGQERWDTAVKLIKGGVVNGGYQFQDGWVRLYVDNLPGSHIATRPPYPNALFDVLRQCGQRCANFELAPRSSR